MRAWQMTEIGNPSDVLELATVPDPEPGPGQVLLRVDSCGLKFPDILQIQGRYQVKPTLPFIPGGEIAGTIVALGPDLDDSAPAVGDRVLVMGEGGLAEHVAVSPRQCLPIPDQMSSEQAAAMLVNYGTGVFALRNRARLQAGESVLVTAAAGGVGSAAIQLAKAIGATVYGLAGGEEKVEVVRSLGADEAFDYRNVDIVDTVRDVTGGAGVDVVYEAVGGDVFDQVRRVVAWDGRLLVIGFTSGRIPEAPANHILLKNYSIVGVHWGAHLARRAEALREDWDSVVELFGTGKVDPLISEVRPLAEALDALAAIGNRRTVGKVIIRPGE
ncbi:MAG: NADPH:quinone oxidoreductase family protein [Acidimicrobiia bacterium]|nr:NADPH:quinone oxidoreductase family protein [Acidimicrobiia bacterium]